VRQAYDLAQGGDGLKVKTLSSQNLERQIGSDGATWLDRELTARQRLEIADSGFGRDIREASTAAPLRLVDMGYATTKDSFIQIPRHTAALLEQREVERVGRHLQNRIGQYITGVQRDDGGVEWGFGRKRELGL
jgi:hypothetical protein